VYEQEVAPLRAGSRQSHFREILEKKKHGGRPEDKGPSALHRGRVIEEEKKKGLKREKGDTIKRTV